MSAEPKVWDGWLHIKGGVEVAGRWIDKNDYDRLNAGRVNAPCGTTSEPALREPQGKTGESPALPSTAPIEAPYLVRTFWSPDQRYLVTVHVTTVGVIALQDDNGIEWEPSGPQQDMTKVVA